MDKALEEDQTKFTYNDKKIEIFNKFPTSELREIEQYFFSDTVLSNLVESLNYEENILCLCTPAVANAFKVIKDRDVICLDLDKRFDYLPGYQYYDLLKPFKIVDFTPNIIIIDPPFFKINLNDLLKCVDLLTDGNKSTKILFAFVIREERALLAIFKSYNLKFTKFKMEYKYVDPTKWSNYGLYSNFEIGKIKFNSKIKKPNLKGIKTVK